MTPYDLDHMGNNPTADMRHFEPDWDGYFHSSVLSSLPSSNRRGSRVIEVPARATVFARGERAETVFYVLSGEIRLVQRSRSGSEMVVQRTRLGFLAEATLFQYSYDCDAIATRTSRVLSIGRSEFCDSLTFESFRNCWIAYLAQRLRWERARAERLSLNTAAERIVHYVETVGNAGVLHLNQSKKDWAVDLGLTHEALYRALAQMQQQGQLSVDGPRIMLSKRRRR
ncbi:CRP-like cAMP-binding protein [Bradyrhizobium japonicum]